MKFRYIKIPKYQQGAAILAAVVFLMFIGISVALGTAALSIGEAKTVPNFVNSKQSYYTAEAGVEDAVYRVKENKYLSSTEVLVIDNSVATTTTINIGGDSKQVISGGNNGGAIRNIQGTLATGVGASFNYGAQVGYLGLVIKENASVNGSIFSNGSVNKKGTGEGSVITGDAWVAGGIGTTTDQEQLNRTIDFNIHDIDGHQDGGQSFIPSVTAEPLRVSFYVKKVGNPDNVTVKIVPDDGGKPKHNNAIASGKLDKNKVTENFGWVDMTFNSTDPITYGVQYWIVVSTNGHNDEKYYVFGADDDSSYTNGTFLRTKDWTSKNAIWFPEGGDIAFKIYLGTETTSLSGISVGGDVHANTIDNAAIAGDAYYKTIINSTVGGTQYSGSADPLPINPPLSDALIDQFKADGDAGGVCGISDGCDAQGNYLLDNQGTGTLGPIKINGDFRVKNQATLTVTGTIHVTGNIKFDNKCVIKLDPSYSSNSGIIVGDGTVDVDNRCDFQGSGDPNSYFTLITTSKNIDGPPAMRVSDKVKGALFYASRGGLKLENQVDVKAVYGNSIELENNSTITYETGLANVQFLSGPSGGWKIDSWGEVE